MQYIAKRPHLGLRENVRVVFGADGKGKWILAIENTVDFDSTKDDVSFVDYGLHSGEVNLFSRVLTIWHGVLKRLKLRDKGLQVCKHYGWE